MPQSPLTRQQQAQAITQCMSWRSDGSPSCLGGSSNGCFRGVSGWLGRVAGSGDGLGVGLDVGWLGWVSGGWVGWSGWVIGWLGGWVGLVVG